MSYQHFYELDAWKRARQCKTRIYPLLKRFPPYEQYELTSQLRRAVRSIPANISEGHGRRTIKDELNFCIIARGSLSEVLNHLIDARDSGYISKEELLEYKKQWDEIRKVLNGYISYLQSRIPIPKNASATRGVQETEVIYNEHLPGDIEEDDLFHHLGDSTD